MVTVADFINDVNKGYNPKFPPTGHIYEYLIASAGLWHCLTAEEKAEVGSHGVYSASYLDDFEDCIYIED